MCDSEIEIIHFDKFLQDYFKSFNESSKPPESVDGYCIINGEKTLIEFKNGEFKRKDIVKKIGHSVLTLLSKEDLSLNELKKDTNFLLVFNKEKVFKKQQNRDLNESGIQYSSSKDDITNLIFKRAGLEKVVYFNLNTFKNIYFNKIMTLDESEFNKLISKASIKCPN